MKFLCTHEEAAKVFYGGDEEALRQAIIFSGLRPLVEVSGLAVVDDFEEIPRQGETVYGRWFTTHDGKTKVSGWFYVDAEKAAKWLWDRRSVSGWEFLWAKENSGVPWYGDFVLDEPAKGPLWFLISDLKRLNEPLQLVAAELPNTAPPPEKLLGTRERNNLLRVIAGLAVEAKIDLRSDKAAIQIAAAGQKFGGPDERTTRKLVSKIRDSVLPADWKMI